MAKYGSGDVAFVLLDGYSLAGYTTEFSDEIEALTEETTVLGDTYEAVAAVGMKKAKFSWKGFYDDTALAANAALVTASGTGPGTARVMCYGIATNAKGKKFTGYLGAMEDKYSRIASRGALHKAEASFTGQGEVLEGDILHELTAETSASGNSDASSVDNGAASSNGGRGFLQVTAITLGGYTSFTVTNRMSTDNISFVAGQAFSAVTARGALTGSIGAGGSVYRYMSSGWVFNGAGSGQTATFMCGFARK